MVPYPRLQVMGWPSRRQCDENPRDTDMLRALLTASFSDRLLTSSRKHSEVGAVKVSEKWLVVTVFQKVFAGSFEGVFSRGFLLQIYIYIYMGSGRFPGPMELLLQQLVRVSKTRWRWFNLSKSMLLQPLIKKLEVLVMINQWTTYCINDNNDERWMVVLIDFYLTFCKN